jgi:hypothetical protein
MGIRWWLAAIPMVALACNTETKLENRVDRGDGDTGTATTSTTPPGPGETSDTGWTWTVTDPTDPTDPTTGTGTGTTGTGTGTTGTGTTGTGTGTTGTPPTDSGLTPPSDQDLCNDAATLVGYLDQFQTPGDDRVLYCHSGAGGSWNFVESNISSCLPHLNHNFDVFPTTGCDS